MSDTANVPVFSIAGITNVGLCARAMERVINRNPALPGIATFTGPSGSGKSFSASYVANRFRAYYVECKSTWTRKAFLLAVLQEMGIDPVGDMTNMMNQIGEELVLSQRPLIVDEMDYLVGKKAVEVVRDIHMISDAPILLIGEENMLNKLMKWERFHNRILEPVLAEKASLVDVKELAKIYARGINVDVSLLKELQQASAANVRRICVNLDRIREYCRSQGVSAIDKTGFKQPFFTGEPPRRRA
ncbi:hypothetical protein ACH42_09755 [Endozoicomonas sp. (ex Bugula neritina AB1)]|nr:hypothetical protein ACH42_09755 [Endozoicomonas sp. (ex Bugula neritina AB1)]